MAIEFRFSVLESPVLRGIMRAPDSVSTAVDRKLERGALETARTLRRNAPKAHSTLTQSIQVRREALMSWRVGPTVEHGIYQELGTRGGSRMPPVSAISDWVRTKLQISDPRERRAVAWVIAKKIRDHGVPAQPFVQPLYEDPAWRARIKELALQGVREGLGMRGR